MPSHCEKLLTGCLPAGGVRARCRRANVRDIVQAAGGRSPATSGQTKHSNNVKASDVELDGVVMKRTDAARRQVVERDRTKSVSPAKRS